MTTNASMTLYHKKYSRALRKDEYKKSIIENVMWQGGKGTSVNEGYENANDVRIYIPKSKNDLSNIEFSQGDIVVKGTIDTEITVQQDLNGVDDVYNITTIIDRDYGSLSMQHIELGGK